MPRYYFNIDDGVSPRDTEGMQLDNVVAAKCEAAKFLGALVCDEAGAFWERVELNLTVSDEAGLSLFTLHFIGIDVASVSETPTP